MNPLFIVAGIAIAAGTAAWLFDSATEDEELRHEQLRQQINELNKQLGEFDIKLETLQQEHLKKALSELLAKLSLHHRTLCNKIDPIEKELKTLPENIRTELENETLSPYRRRALQQNFCKVEDAQARLEAYKAYLSWYEQRLSDYGQEVTGHLSAEQLSAILAELQPPSPTLPAEWLYPGKVVLVEHHEIDRDLTFNSRLHLTSNFGLQGRSNDFQKSLFFNYHNQEAIPLQIVHESEGKRGHRIYYGCVARGIAYVDGILSSAPLEFDIERGNRLGYFAHSMGKTIKAFLPRQLTTNPLIDLVPGQKIEAWADLYNLKLDATPGTQTQKKAIQISMLGNTASGTVEERQLYLYLQPNQLKAEWGESLYANDPTPWHLVETGDLSLSVARHNICCACAIDIENACLRVTHVSEYTALAEGYVLPFTLIPADVRLEAQSLRSPDALDALISFVNHIASSAVNRSARLAQSQLLHQWGEVLHYQQQQNEFHIQGTLGEFATEGYEVVMDYKVPANEPGMAAFIKQFKEIQRSGFIPHCRLAYWGDKGDGEFGWLEPVPFNQRKRLNVQEENQQLTLRLPVLNAKAMIAACEDAPERTPLRLCLYVFDDALKRQSDALEAFRYDALVEPRIKDILLAPSLYRAEQDPWWIARFSAGIEWQNPRLTSAQQDVIKKVLCEKYLSLVQGPPGTAKTTCIVELLHQIFSYRADTRVLLVSQQHVAVDNALERFVASHARELADRDVRLLRIGPENKIDGKLREFTLQQQQLEFVQKSRVIATQAACSGDEDEAALASQWLYDVLGPEQSEGNTKYDQELVWMLLSSNNLVGATCVGLASRKQSIDQLRFDVVIIDEAGRSTVPELLIPILRAKKVVLIGDHFQLPPSIAPLLQTDEANEELPFLEACFLETSFFETLYNELPQESKCFLSEQFRMPGPIGDLVATLFYSPDGKRMLYNGRDIEPTHFIHPVPLMWKDIQGHEAQEGTSKKNVQEAKSIVTFLVNLAGQMHGGSKEVAVITPYGAQKRLLRSLIAEHCPEPNGDYQLGNLNIRINTVDSFQGSEADIVLYSVVRTRGNLRFILDWKRLNVACSRARENLIFFGDFNFLKSKKRNTNERNLFAEVIEQIPPGGIMLAPRGAKPVRKENSVRSIPRKPA
ncbi:DEAD/DEAH box helicase [Pectobacterium aroidearum]|uniref:DEAD/DEAH box helicase n=1 Tax=Pectobacterium aroidearum TaxID=1201031 RepID=UPI0032EBEA1A